MPQNNDLIVHNDILMLQRPNDRKPFYIDFLAGKVNYRSQHTSLRKEALAKALGCKPTDNATIVDATAGLGRDSFILASLGYHVIMLERSDTIHALLADGLRRAHTALPEIVDRLTLIHTNAITWLKTAPPPDIVYIDPMFPERKKSASVKKEMVLLQELLGKDEDSELLFQTAFACAKQRVVVKRPRLAEKIATNVQPNFSLIGKSSRFDIYLTVRRS